MIKKVLSYLLSPFFHVYYGLMFLIFHPIQLVSHYFGGDYGRRRSIDWLNIFLVKGLHILGSKVRFAGIENLPTDRPIIIVSNHQSIYDIPAVSYAFMKHYPKFISKIELGKNRPTISYNLRHGQSALIDRNNGAQSVKAIFKLGRHIQENNYAACIFPEGTRSKDGQVKKFMPAGINTLLRAAPSALIVPFVIDGHDRLMRKGVFPLQFGQKITYTALPAVDPKDYSVEEVVSRIERAIQRALNQNPIMA
jgi:1-acyl-sn-glycerol-3-phosphate acyltransferase